MADGNEERQPAPCPECAGPSEAVRYAWNDGTSSRWRPRHCAACDALRDARLAAFDRELRVLLPDLSARLFNVLRWEFGRREHGLAELLAADDARLLAVRQISHGMLAAFRALWPAPARASAAAYPDRRVPALVGG